MKNQTLLSSKLKLKGFRDRALLTADMNFNALGVTLRWGFKIMKTFPHLELPLLKIKIIVKFRPD